MNKKCFIWLMISVFVVLCIRGELSGKIWGNIVGKVVDEETGKGIEGVTVYLGNETWTETDKNGKFYFKSVYPTDYYLRYEAPFPYVAQLTYRDKQEPAGEDYITLAEGENKHIVKELKKGGGVRGNIELEGVEKIDFKTVGTSIDIYKVEKDSERYKDLTLGTEGMYEIEASPEVEEDGRYEIVGLPEGRIIIVVQGRGGVKPEERYYFPGKLKIVDIRKEEWVENADFYLEENKEENADLKVTVISSIDNRVFKKAVISIKRIEEIWDKELCVEVYSEGKEGEGEGIFSFVLEPGSYVLDVGVFQYGLGWRDKRIKGEHWDEKEIEVEIKKGQLKEITVYFNMKIE
jgi:hypothetical protein